MAEPRSNRIAEWRRAKGWSQQKLADALQVHWTTVSKLERGITRLDTTTLEKISNLLSIDEAHLLPRNKIFRRLPISGQVHYNGIIEAVDDKDPSKYVNLTSEFYDDPNNFFLEVAQGALYPYFKNGDVLALSWIYDEERRGSAQEINYEDFFGRFCLVENSNGEQFLGILGPGTKKDVVNLHNANIPPITDIEPFALAQVTTAYMGIPARAWGDDAEPDS